MRAYFIILFGLFFNMQLSGQSADTTAINFLSTLLSTPGYSHTGDELASAKFYTAEFKNVDYPYHHISRLNRSAPEKANLVRIPTSINSQNILCKEYLLPQKGDYIKLLRQFTLTNSEFENDNVEIENCKLFFIHDARLYQVGFFKNGVKDSVWITNYEDYPLPSFELYRNGKSIKGYKSVHVTDDKDNLWADGELFTKPSIKEGITNKKIGEITFHQIDEKVAKRVFYPGGLAYKNENDSLIIFHQFAKKSGPCYLHWNTELRKEIKDVDSILYSIKGFKKFKNKDLGISFYIPKKWKYFPENQEVSTCKSGYFASKDSLEMEYFNDCHDSIIFRIQSFNTPFDSCLKENWDYKIKDGKYYSDVGYINEANPIDIEKKGEIVYLHHFNNCRIYCNEDQVNPIVECENLILSKGEQTIAIHNSNPFEVDVLNTILNSISFNTSSFKRTVIKDYISDIHKYKYGTSGRDETIYLIEEDLNLDGKKDILISAYWKGEWGNAGGEWRVYFQTDSQFVKCSEAVFMNHEAARFDSITGNIITYVRINANQGIYKVKKINTNCKKETGHQTTLKGENGGDVNAELKIMWGSRKEFKVLVGTVHSNSKIDWTK